MARVDRVVNAATSQNRRFERLPNKPPVQPEVLDFSASCFVIEERPLTCKR